MQMKKSTTCGRREMRALMQTREVNMAAPNTRVHYTGLRGAKGQPIVDRTGAHRKRRDHGTAAWNAEGGATRARPRNERRIYARISAKDGASDRDLAKSSRIIARNRRTRVGKANGR